MNIVLTGFMASGKTTVARLIDEISDFKFIDTDEMVARSEQLSINEIFARHGEAYFRDREHEAVCEAAKMDNMVISTGGGVVLNKANLAALRKTGVIINLAPDFDVIKKRLTASAPTRPLANNKSMDEVKCRYDERREFYDDCDYKMNITDETSPYDIANRILEFVNKK